ncbi:MAG TPA: amino acid adenylation domain-containing protein [Clostridiaceae bacterium]|nr:amino acid adenylation domain-containing protein [Clostridiaceae bacterium]
MNKFLQALEKHASITPDKKALVCAEKSLTYAELRGAVAGVASSLLETGVRAGSIVPVLLRRGTDSLVAALGVLKAGAAVVIINPDYPQERIDFIISDTGGNRPVDESFMRSCAGRTAQADWPEPGVKDPALVVYTSGSTGNPKGVINSWQALLLALDACVCGRSEDDVFISTLSFSFVGITVDSLVALYLGSTLHIATDEVRRDATALLDCARENGISTAIISPQLLAQVLERGDVPFKSIMTGSEKVSMLHSDTVKLYCMYGASETCGPFTAFPIDKPYAVTPCGLPSEGSAIYILDDAGKVLPPGETGEICVSGQIADGYINLPELTEEKFIPNPFAAGTDDARLFRTGDLGFLRPDGMLEYVQRKDWMLKVRGFRVEPGEIEAVITSRTPARQAVVIGYSNVSGQTSLYAVYTADQALLATEVEDAIRSYLPDYMMPSFMEQVEALPLNVNGKIDRKAISPPDAKRFKASYTPPANEREALICQAFETVLGVENVGALDDFILLGGDSIAAVRAEALLPDINISDLLTLRTPRALGGTKANALELPIAPERAFWPLTDAESQMAAEYALNPEGVSYNIENTITLRGDIDVTRWRDTLRALVRRNRILRSSYPVRDGEYVHVIHDDIAADLLHVTCAAEDVPEQIAALNSPYDLENGPLFRFALFQTGNESGVLFLGFHHIILDGSCIERLLGDIENLYNDTALSPAAPDLFDFAVWRKENPPTDDGANFFAAMFKDGLPDNDMPGRVTRPDILPVVNRTIRWDYPAGETAEAARRYAVTPYTLIMAVIAMVLGKYTSSEDVVLGAAMSGRALPSCRDIIGMFANTVVLRAKPSGNAVFSDYLAEVDTVMAGVRRYQDYPFHQLVRSLEIERVPSRHPVFDVLVNYIGAMPVLQLNGVQAQYRHLSNQRLPVDIQLEIFEEQNTLRFELSYAHEVYMPEIMENMAVQLQVSLARVCRDRALLVMDAAELPDAQREAILAGFRGLENNDGREMSVVEQFCRQAARAPHNPAVAFNDIRLDYAELDDLTDRIATELRRRGIGKGDHVGILVGRSQMMPVSALGVLKSGAAYLPLDPTYPAERLQFMLADAEVHLCLADEELCSLLAGYDGDFLLSHTLESLPPAASLPQDPEPDDLFVLLYTSGTTGTPKGVCLCHDNLNHFCAWYRRYYGMTERDQVGAYASFGFDACLMDMFPALTSGAAIHIIPEEMRLDVEQINEYYNRHGVSLAFMTTQLGRQFAAEMANDSLRHLSSGGETLVPFTPKGSYAFHNLYGPTECTIISTAFEMDRHYDRVPIGRPVDNTSLYVLDRHGRLAPVGVQGELGIAGRSVARGYLNRPDITAEKFVSNPFDADRDFGRIYQSGDVVRYLPDGNLDFLGRKDFQVKIRGFRVELSEIEGRIRQHPTVLDAAVIAMDAPGGGKCAAAYLVLSEPLDIPLLSRFIQDKLPPYMVPATFTEVERIPLNPNGKVDRRKLPAPSFPAAAADTESAAAAPTDLGRGIADVVSDVLGHRQFGMSTNLLQAGLASLNAIKLCTRLKKHFGAAPSVQSLLADPTVLYIENAIIGQLLDLAREPKDDTAVPQMTDAYPDRANGYPLSGSQMGVYLDSQNEPDSIMYNIPCRVDLSKDINAGTLAAAVETVLKAHQGIMVRIAETENGIRQFPLAEPVAIERLKLQADELESFAAAFVRPFNLADGPLCRIAVVTTPDGVSLFADFHHIVFDGASMDLFLRQTAAAYEGKSVPTEQTPAYAYGCREQQQEKQGAWAAHRDFFGSMLRDFGSASEISADLQGKGRARLALARSKVDRRAVDVFCRDHGYTPAGLFLAASCYAIGRWTGSADVGISTISSGRSDLSLGDSFGMFVRTLPLVIRMENEQSVLAYISGAHDVLRQSVSHEAYPYTRIAEEHGFRPSIMYACELGVLADYEIAGEPMRMTSLEPDEPKFKISIHVEEDGDNTMFSVQYNDTLYSSVRMDRFADTLSATLSAMITRPASLIQRVSIVSASEAARLQRFRPASSEPLSCALLHGMFEKAADRSPGATALIACDGSYSYRALDEEANRIANALLEKGLQPEDKVAFILPRTGRVLMTMLGVLKAGGAYVPLSPDYPAARIRQILEDSGASWLITTGADLDAYENALDVDELRRHPRSARPSLPIRPNQLAYIIYTSGSTGKPKGVMIEHGSIANYVTPAEENRHIHALVQDATRMMSITTVTFDMFLKESTAAICNGLTLVFADEEAAQDPIRLAALFKETGADAFNATPSRLMEYTTYPALLKAIQNCRVVMAGAEKYPPALMTRLRQNNPHAVRLFNTYGPTEITVSSNAKELTHADHVTIGAPLFGVTEHVMDDDGNELPAGVVGELWIGGRGVARGYVNLPEQTAERFVTYKGMRMYRSGDLARWTDDGEIMLLGRNDKQIKLRGLRIELGEVEAALLAVDGIKNGAVIVRTIQGVEQLCAYYVADRPLNPTALRDEMSKSLSSYMLPGAWLRLDQFPQTANGKIDYNSLPEPDLLRNRDYIPPATALEETICAVFAHILEREPGDIGALDSFFDIGGTSLSVTRVVVALNEKGLKKESGDNITFSDVFKNATARELAALLKRGINKVSSGEPADAFDYGAIESLLKLNTLDAFRSAPPRAYGNVLLTGATGFLGIHILQQLLRDSETKKIYCLMRRGRQTSAEERLKHQLFYYFEDAFSSAFDGRVIVLEGDLTCRDSFAELKDASIQTVINCAANVTHFASDDSISKTNTEGVRNLIDLCLAAGARLIQVSTASVSGFAVDGNPGPDKTLFEQTLYLGQNLENQYVQSKFLAERAMLEACAAKGLDAKIMRVGNLMARHSDGEFQMNAASNSFLGRLRAYSVIGCFPYSAYLTPARLAPIDNTAEAILLLGRTATENTVYHPYNDHSIFLGDIIMMMRQEGIPVELTEDDHYAKVLDATLNDPDKAEYLTALVAYQGIAGGRIVTPVPVDNSFTTQSLLRMGWRWPVTDDNYLHKFLKDLITLGFFERPQLTKSEH